MRRVCRIRAHHHRGEAPQHASDRQENTSNRVLHRIATGPRSNEKSTGERAENCKGRRRPEMLVLAVFLPSTTPAAFTIVKPPSRSSAVVPPSAGTAPT